MMRARQQEMGYEAVKLINEDAESMVIGVKDDKIFTMDFIKAIKVKRKPNLELIQLADLLSN